MFIVRIDANRWRNSRFLHLSTLNSATKICIVCISYSPRALPIISTSYRNTVASNPRNRLAFHLQILDCTVKPHQGEITFPCTKRNTIPVVASIWPTSNSDVNQICLSRIFPLSSSPDVNNVVKPDTTKIRKIPPSRVSLARNPLLDNRFHRSRIYRRITIRKRGNCLPSGKHSSFDWSLERRAVLGLWISTRILLQPSTRKVEFARGKQDDLKFVGPEREKSTVRDAIRGGIIFRSGKRALFGTASRFNATRIHLERMLPSLSLSLSLWKEYFNQCIMHLYIQSDLSEARIRRQAYTTE